MKSQSNLSLTQILILCSLVFFLIAGGGYVLSLKQMPVELKIGLILAIILTIWVVFPWLWSRRNPDAQNRRKAGLYLIVGGLTVLSSLLFAGFNASLDIAGRTIKFDFLLQGEWWTDIILGISPLVMFYLGYLLLKVPKEEIRLEKMIEEAEIHAEEEDDFSDIRAYEPPSREVFWVRVRKLFELKSFNRYQCFGDLNEANCIVGRQYEDEGERTVVIRCDDRNVIVQQTDVDALISHAKRIMLNSRNNDLRMFYVVPSSDLLKDIKQFEFNDVKFKTEKQLLTELINFTPYLRKLKAEYELAKLPYSLRTEKKQKTLAETYVLPRFSLSEGSWDNSLESYLDNWLQESGARHLVLLGDYGMGKSSFVTHFAAGKAEAWLQGDTSGRIPILLKLGGSSPRNDPGVQRLLAVFIDNNKLGCTTEALRYLMREGHLVILLDGFDEMDLIGSEEQRRRHFEELWSLAEHGNKIMISGRPGYFPNTNELYGILKVANQALKQGTGARYCTTINLQPFRSEDIALAFKKYFDSQEKARLYLNIVFSQDELTDLAQRPALMHIIRDTLSQEGSNGVLNIQSKGIKPAALLRIYTEHWLIREKEKPRTLLIADKDRIQFSKELAVWMMTEDRVVVTSDELLELYKDWFPNNPEFTANNYQVLEGLKSDLRTCTFMVPDGDLGFKFAHMPFLEYFVAVWIVDNLLGDPDFDLPHSVIWNMPWRREISKHVADLLSEKLKNNEIYKLLESRLNRQSPYQIYKAMFKAKKAGGDLPDQKKLQVSTFYSPTFNITQVQLYAGIPLKRTLLYRRHNTPNFLILEPIVPLNYYLYSVFKVLIREKKSSIFYTIKSIFERYAALFPLLDYEGADLRDTAFQGVNFEGVSFRGADLQDANLQGCDLRRVDFRNANLRNADIGRAELNGADLRGVYLQETELRSAIFYRTDLRKADLQGCNLQGTIFFNVDLRGANLQDTDLAGHPIMLEKVDFRGADLRRANLREADLRETDLRETDLREADLREADLREADLREADLREANLKGANLRETTYNDDLQGIKSKPTPFSLD